MMKVFFSGFYEKTKVLLNGELSLDDYQPILELFVTPEISESLFHKGSSPIRRFTSIQVLSEQAESIVLLECVVAEATHMFNGGYSMVKISIKFRYAIKQELSDAKYRETTFSFSMIDKLFPYDEVDCEHLVDNRDHIVVNPNIIEHPLTALGCSADTNVNSIITYSENSYPFSLDYQQKKQMKIVFSQSQSINAAIQYIVQVRKYFEFVLEHRISILELSLKIKDQSFAEILYAPEINLHQARSNAVHDRYCKSHLQYDELILGLNRWIMSYEKYSIAYDIWLKQLYNDFISIEDRILWNAQTIEYICQVEEAIYNPSQTLANTNIKKRNREPNLEHYLMTLQKEYNFTSVAHTAYFKDAKDVRDKITHNNPRKPISERMLKNTDNLLYYISRRLIGKHIGLERLPAMLVMKPEENENTN